MALHDNDADVFNDGSCLDVYRCEDAWNMADTSQWIGDPINHPTIGQLEPCLNVPSALPTPKYAETSQGHGIVGDVSCSFSFWISPYNNNGLERGTFAVGGLGTRYNAEIHTEGLSSWFRLHKEGFEQAIPYLSWSSLTHCVITYDTVTKNVKLYTNNVLRVDTTFTMIWSDNPFEIKSIENFLIDQIMVFDRVITTTEINDLYNMEKWVSPYYGVMASPNQAVSTITLQPLKNIIYPNAVPISVTILEPTIQTIGFVIGTVNININVEAPSVYAEDGIDIQIDPVEIPIEMTIEVPTLNPTVTPLSITLLLLPRPPIINNESASVVKLRQGYNVVQMVQLVQNRNVFDVVQQLELLDSQKVSKIITRTRT